MQKSKEQSDQYLKECENRQELPAHTIKVMSFKQSGKYYDEFIVDVHAEPTWYNVIKAVRARKEAGCVPQTGMDWLIGHTEEDLLYQVAQGVYPIILKG